LADGGRFGLARKLAEAFGAPKPAAAVADGDFDDPSAHYPFGWGITDASELGASRDRENGTAALIYHANPGEGGQVAAQLLTLPPGSYELVSRARASVTETAPLWTLSCAPSVRLIVTLAVASGAPGVSSTRFSVPANCPAQWLVLNLRPALTPQSGAIESVSIAAR
jgi:hypothetical protein